MVLTKNVVFTLIGYRFYFEELVKNWYWPITNNNYTILIIHMTYFNILHDGTYLLFQRNGIFIAKHNIICC